MFLIIIAFDTTQMSVHTPKISISEISELLVFKNSTKSTLPKTALVNVFSLSSGSFIVFSFLCQALITSLLISQPSVPCTQCITGRLFPSLGYIKYN